jgi:hypothetical protein
MNAKLTLRERLNNAATRTLAKEELRRRTLEIVNRLGRADDIAVWRESAPDFLPFDLMLAEVRAMHAEGKLYLDVLGPGHLVIRSLSFKEAAPPQPAKKDVGEKEPPERREQESQPTAKPARAKAVKSAKPAATQAGGRGKNRAAKPSRKAA